MERKIEMIEINKLYPHPNNPRKDLGDLTELTDSIKKSGVLQNLTVVPYGTKGEEYTVIIGHRRMVAAQKAGLTHLPCIVLEMSKREQLATMLAENMQRNDLTVLEQAEGIQLMLDFGDSFDDVAEATGLSSSTVRRRARIAKYNRDKVKASFERGATLFDYEELEKIKDPEVREKLLDHIGTHNFSWKLQSALSDQRDNEWLDKVEAEVKGFAEITDDVSDKEWIKRYSTWRKEEVQVPMPDRKYFYIRTSNDIVIYSEIDDAVKAENEKNEKIEEERRKERDGKIEILKKVSVIAYEKRRDFIKNITGCEKLSSVIMRFAMWAIWNDMFDYNEPEDFYKFCGVSLDDVLAGKGNISDIKALLFSVYGAICDDERNGYSHTYSTIYQENEELDMIYRFLIELGYEMSDEELEWKDGTHCCYEGEDKA